jgi:NADPH:quinone reductase-like Zn-dependent oxidoreductase
MENKSFKALVAREGEEKKFTRAIETKNIEDLPEGDVVIKVLYTSVNYKDALRKRKPRRDQEFPPYARH